VQTLPDQNERRVRKPRSDLLYRRCGFWTSEKGAVREASSVVALEEGKNEGELSREPGGDEKKGIILDLGERSIASEKAKKR